MYAVTKAGRTAKARTLRVMTVTGLCVAAFAGLTTTAQAATWVETGEWRSTRALAEKDMPSVASRCADGRGREDISTVENMAGYEQYRAVTQCIN